MKGKNIIRCTFIISMLCIFLTGCEGQQESIQPSIDVEPINTTELETEEQDLEIIFKYDCFNWNEVDFTYLHFKNQSEFESTIREYIKVMTEYTEYEDWYLEYGANIEKCAITFKFDNISFGSYDNLSGKTDPVRKVSESKIATTITLNKLHFETGIPILPHELTHMIFNPIFSQSLCEGLCEYHNRKCAGEKSDYYKLKCKSVNDFLKGYSEVVINAIDNETAREYENVKAEIMDSVGRMEKGYPYGFSSTGSGLWFALSESFVEYLIDQYGIEKFMEFYKNAETEEGYTMLDTEGYEKIKNDWIAMYNEYESEINYEEFNKNVEDFRAKRNNKE